MADPSDPNRATCCGRCWVGWHAESLSWRRRRRSSPRWTARPPRPRAPSAAMWRRLRSSSSSTSARRGTRGGRRCRRGRRRRVEHTLLLSSLGTRLYNRIPFARGDQGGRRSHHCLRHATTGAATSPSRGAVPGRQGERRSSSTRRSTPPTRRREWGKAGAGAVPKARPRRRPRSPLALVCARGAAAAAAAAPRRRRWPSSATRRAGG